MLALLVRRPGKTIDISTNYLQCLCVVGLSKLQSEIRQNKPFRSGVHEATLALFRTTDFIVRGQAKLIEPMGISGEQYNVLRILRGAGADGLPTLEVADRMVVRSPAITRLLDKLELKRLIVRRRCKQDRRRVYCSITPAGLSLLAELDEPINEHAEAAMAGVDKPDVVTLIRILDQIRVSAHEHISDEPTDGKTAKEKKDRHHDN